MTDGRAAHVHRQAIVIDGHSDILGPVADGLCRLAERTAPPTAKTWARLTHLPADKRATPYSLSGPAQMFGALGHYDVPRFQEGGVTCQVMAAYVTDAYLPMALQRCLDMFAAFHRELRDNPETLTLALSTDDIRTAKQSARTALVLAIEGAEPVGNRLDYFNLFHKLGLRMVGLSHSRRNALADGTQMHTETGGLSALGVKAVERLNDLGVVIDMAHLADPGLWQVLDLTRQPVIVSHASALVEYPGYRAPYLAVDLARHKSKLQALAANGGLLGIVFWNQADVDTVVREILAVVEHVGPNHVGLGSDYFGPDRAPRGLEHIGRLPRLTDAMLSAGLDDESVLKILGGNYLRVFDAVWGADRMAALADSCAH